MGYTAWREGYETDPAAVGTDESGRSLPHKYIDCTAVHIDFLVQAEDEAGVREALARLTPPGGVAQGEPEFLDERTASGPGHWCARATFRVDWDWAES